MRIAIDMQGAQSESRFRGIGRYSMAFAQAVVRNRGKHDVILVLSSLYPETIKPFRDTFQDLLPQENILVWSVPGPVREDHLENTKRREVAELIREAFFANLQADIVHICSFIEGYSQNSVNSIGCFDNTCPISVTLYDIIPLVNARDYLQTNPPFAKYYQRKIEHIKQAKHFLAISGFSRQEAITHLGLSDLTCINVSTATDQHFMPKLSTEAENQKLFKKIGLTRAFLLCAGAGDPRKNLIRLIQAYAKLPMSLRIGHQLLLVGKMLDQEVVLFKNCARSAGLQPDELLIFGYVTEGELVQLYNLCKLYVFPSWYEGFGLPALEAMSCGAPVIASHATSLPEVVGLDAAMFNPLDVNAIAQKMQQALEDDTFRNMLKVHGLQQAKLFSWNDTAKRAILAWEQGTIIPEVETQSWSATLERTAIIYKKLLGKFASILSVDDDDHTLQKIALSLAQNEKQIYNYFRRGVLPKRIGWRLEGPFDNSYSLAIVNREMARALLALGHDVVLHSTEGHGDYVPNAHYLAANPDLVAMYKKASTITCDDADITSRNLYPPRVSKMHSRLNTLHAYAWEESGFPLDWVDEFNQNLQGMTVNSNHVKKIMVDHGVTVPVAVSSLGVDHWQRVVVDQEFSIQAKSFCFLHVSSCFPRKGADVMLQAYGRAFRATDDVTLVIKTFANPHNNIHIWLAELQRDDPNFPDVKIIETDLSDSQLKALYLQCQVLIAPSRAEGFGLPMAEALLSGLAVVTTGWGGQNDFCTLENSWLIDFEFVRAQSHFDLWVSAWAEPDENHLCQLLQEVYKTPLQQRLQRTEVGRKLLLDQFSWSQAAKRVVDAARQWSAVSFVPEIRIAWVTSWNTKCGIATYSEHLINNMSHDVTILAAYANLMLTPDGDNVKRCWNTSESETLDDLSKAVKQSQCQTLVIQFNYGFFKFNYFSKFLNEQIDLGVKVVVALHATRDPVNSPQKRLSILSQAFKRCDRILVHSISDLNRLKKLGLVGNVTLFPHGVLDKDLLSLSKIPSSSLEAVFDKHSLAPHLNPLQQETKHNQFVIASYGFFLPNKGLLELIDAISILNARGMNVKLMMINAEYPIQESTSLINQANLKISKLNLQHIVTLCTDYLTDLECIERLAQADLVVYPYQQTLESASGAVRYGMASGIPVAVTPLSIFDDVVKATYILPGFAPEDLAKGCLDIEKSIRVKDNVSKAIQTAATAWRQQHRYSRVGNQLNGLLQAISQESCNSSSIG